MQFSIPVSTDMDAKRHIKHYEMLH